MANTKIEWCERSWNPITGCSKISEGCKHCYAERMSKRLAGRCGYDKDEPFKVTFHPDKLDEPLRWRKPSRIFVCSMGDLFHEGVDDGLLCRVFDVMAVAEHHTFLILTKRPARMREFFARCVHGNFQNLWLGVTAENQQRADERIPILLQIPAAKRFVSVEPMLGEIDITKYLTQLDWVICGCESGPNRRTCQTEWIRDLKNQCISVGVPFFLKQMEVGGKLVKMPELDGQIWNEYPKEGK